MMTIPPAQALEQMRENCKRDLPWLVGRHPHKKTLCIVGGAPSLGKNLGKLREKIRLGSEVMSLNGATKYLYGKFIKPDYHVQFDGRPENSEFLGDFKDTIHLIGSMSHKDVFEKAKGKIIIWHADLALDEEQKILDEHNKPGLLVCGGGTVGLRAMILGHMLGYRKMVLFGMDSSYEDYHHAYEQKLNDNDRKLTIRAFEKEYICAPWMYRQAEEFKFFYRELVKAGCRIEAIGEGLLPDICRDLNTQNMEK